MVSTNTSTNTSTNISYNMLVWYTTGSPMTHYNQEEYRIQLDILIKNVINHHGSYAAVYDAEINIIHIRILWR